MTLENTNAFRRVLREVPIINADNVAQYMLQITECPKWEDWQKAFPNLAPPFPDFWIEYRLPAWVLVGGHRFVPPVAEEDSRVGVLFFAGGGQSIEERWRYNILLVRAAVKQHFAARILRWDQGIDGHGRLVDNTFSGNGKVRLFPDWSRMDEEESRTQLTYVLPTLLALSFFHCKNVHAIVKTPPPALAKRNLERGKPPMLKYHILEIEPMKKVLRQEGRIETGGLQRALHICRGHFAHYPETGPGLFGRGIHGDFWVPQHARGTEKRGVVVKDYSVNPPKTAS